MTPYEQKRNEMAEIKWRKQTSPGTWKQGFAAGYNSGYIEGQAEIQELKAKLAKAIEALKIIAKREYPLAEQTLKDLGEWEQ